jgi:hypothetical protein
MNTVPGSSKRSSTASNRLLAVLVIFWLNLVAAPCALAFGEDHDCPHCPPEHTGEMAAHHGHHEDMANAGCDSVLSDCDGAGSVAHEGRSAQPKLKDKAEPALMAPPALPQATLDIVGFATTAADPPDPHGFGPALYLLNCVFLD